MQVLSSGHIVSMIITLLAIVSVGIYSGRKVKSSADFTTAGKKANWSIVTGTIIGTLVGGVATIGIAQGAFIYGFSAWWFSLGSALGALVLGLFMAKPLWNSNAKTIPEILSREYGNSSRIGSSLITSIALFINVVPQVLALTALFASMFKLNSFISPILSVAMMAVYVIFGGVWGTGLAGVLKIFLLYLSTIITGVVVYINAGGIEGFTSMFPAYPWFSLFGRGVWIDIAAGFSVVVGVVSSQSYVQAIMSAKDVRSSQIGGVVSALLIPPIGFVSVLIGLYMKHTFPTINPADAFPLFVIQYIPPWIGGVILATLFIATVGTGAGVTLGISTVLTNDIFKKYLKPNATDKQTLLCSRTMIVLVLVATLIFISGNMKSMILKWTFLSMGLRGTVACLPLIAALFFKGKISRKGGLGAIFLGPLGVILWTIAGPAKIDPLYVGLSISAACLLYGFWAGKETETVSEVQSTAK